MKILIILISLLNISYANNKPEITISKSLVRIAYDVINTRGKYVDIQVAYNSQTPPEVFVIDEYLGFECELVSVKKINTDNQKTIYNIAVDWSPGADYSGCDLQIENPDNGYITNITLHMAF